MDPSTYPDEVQRLYEGLIKPQQVSPDVAGAAARRCIRQGEASGDHSLVALGLVWQMLLGYMAGIDDEGFDALLQRCVTEAQAADEPYLLGRTYNVLALVALSRGQNLLTYNYLNLVLDCSQHLDGVESQHLESLACGNLGASYFYLGDYAHSYDYDTRALTLREAMSADHDASVIGSYATDVGLSAVGTGQLAVAQRCYDVIQEMIAAEEPDDADPNDLYFSNELGMVLSEALGDVEARDRSIEALIESAALLDDVVSDFISVCQDIDFLLDKELYGQAGRLIENVRPMMEGTSRPYVHVQFLRCEIAHARAVGDEERVARLSVEYYEQGERVQRYDKQQMLDAIAILDMVHKTRDENVRLSYQSRHDELTHLLNRQALREDFPQFYGHHVWAIMIDVDHFKDFNDQMGHGTGDTVLRSVANAIQTSFAQESCYRLGGDEFLVLGADMDAESVLSSIAACQQAVPEVAEGLLGKGALPGTLVVGVSIGYAAGDPADGDELRAITTRADDQLFRAKRAGRGCVRGESEA